MLAGVISMRFRCEHPLVQVPFVADRTPEEHGNRLLGRLYDCPHSSDLFFGLTFCLGIMLIHVVAVADENALDGGVIVQRTFHGIGHSLSYTEVHFE